MEAVGCTSADVFLARLENESAVFDTLIAEITVGETYFFREPEQWDFIRSVVVADLRERRARTGRLRAWSAGTASGEEAYSLAIVLHEAGLLSDHCIVGTDISEAALGRARRARYTRWSMRAVGANLVNQYFRTVDQRLELQRVIRSGVDFRKLNLADVWYPPFIGGPRSNDLILCRNVLIYLDRATATRVALQLFDMLSEGGWLFFGASDPALSENPLCDVIVTPGGLAYRRRADAAHVPNPSDVQGNVVVDTGVVNKQFGMPRIDVPDLRDVPDSPAASIAHKPETRPSAALKDSDAWAGVVRSLANSGQLDEAGFACTRALESHPASAELMYLHALLLHQASHHDEAVAAARRALYLDRRLVVAHLLLGGALLASGSRAGAKRAFTQAERLLQNLGPDETVVASGGATVSELRALARLHVEQLGRR